VGIALNLLDRAMASEGEVENILAEDADTRKLCNLLLNNNEPWHNIAAKLATQQADPEAFRRQVLGYMAKVMLSNGPRAARAWLVVDTFRQPFYDTGWPGLVAAAFEACNGAKGR
jgi:hypothetical protein